MENFWEYITSTKFKICLIAALWGFLTGLERAVIIPTLWLYFKTSFSSNTASHYYGWTLAAFNVAILICDPLFGFLSYRGVRVKTLLVISNQLGIIGNIVYFIASHPWMILLGRLLAGAGAGCEVPLYADIVRITTIQERTPYIVTLLLCRQFGLIIGPATTLLMTNFKFKIGQVAIDIYNGPGLFLAILWGIHTILVLIIYPQLSKDKNKALQRKESRPLVSPGLNSELLNSIHRVSYCSDVIDANLARKSNETLSATDNHHEDGKQCNDRLCLNRFFNPHNYKDYFTLNILSTLFISFASYFSLMGLESVLPPMATFYFNWSQIETSWIYLACGVLVIIVYIGLRLLSSKGFKDRSLLVFGLVSLCISYLWLTICLATITKDKQSLYITLVIIGIGFHVLGQPFTVSCSESLFTKQVSIMDQDRAQSILRMVINIALLIGPFIGGSLETMPYIVFILLFSSSAISIILLIKIYPQLNF